jgi:hypothetical protein
MDVKPQFGAPGGNILSTYPLNMDGYRVADGTSMATPFVAAALALMMEARGKLAPVEMEQLFAATAKPQRFLAPFPAGDGEWQDWLTTPAQQGAGLIQVYDAIYATTLLEPAGLSFNDTANFAGTLNFTLTNTGSDEIVYDISHVPTRTLYSLSARLTQQSYPNEAVEAHADLEFSDTKVTIAAGQSFTVAVTATPPGGLEHERYPLWSGYIAVNGSDGSSQSLLYQGLSGNLHDVVYSTEPNWVSATVFVPGGLNNTFHLPPKGTPLGEVNDLQTPLPRINVNMNWGSPLVEIDVLPLTTCTNATTNAFGYRTIGTMGGSQFPLTYQARGAWRHSWMGGLGDGSYAPPGRYRFVLRTLRIFGDAENLDDWVVEELGSSVSIDYQE